MHTLELGVLLYLLNMALWYLIMASFWGHFSSDGDNSEVELAFNRDLDAWYDFVGIESSHRIVFSFKALGEYPHGSFSCKAAHSKLLLGFIIYCYSDKRGSSLVDRWSDAVSGQALLKCAQDLKRLYRVAAEQPRKMSQDAIAEVRQLTSHLCSQWKRAGGKMRMKHHALAYHFADQCQFAGNFVFSHNYQDETEKSYTRMRASSVCCTSTN